MNRLIIFLSTSILSSLIGCITKDKDIFKREYIDINKEFFYSSDNKLRGDSLIYTMIADINNAFNLKPIKVSDSQNELRIYFASPFAERFFVQRIDNDSIKNEIFDCTTENRNDSFFMKVKSSIKSEGVYKVDNLIAIDSLADYSVFMNADTVPAVTDKGTVYLMQIKQGAKIKFILINNISKATKYNSIEDTRNKIVANIKKDFSFNFSDSWKVITDSAFINPYNLR